MNIYCKTLCQVLLIICMIATNACNPTNSLHTSPKPFSLQDSVVADKDGNQYSFKVMADNNVWMTTNLSVNILGSYCYDNNPEYCKKYGRLYTWESAEKGCSSLGEGWRLPTNNEWQRLAELYGGIPADSVENRKRAFSALIVSGTSKLDAVLSGGRDLDGGFRRLEAHGFYWTATENDSLKACYANFGKNSQSLYHQNGGEKTDGFAVRCINNMHTAR